MDRVFMQPPWGAGEPIEVEAVPEKLTPLMVAGWSQCEPPVPAEEEMTNVHD
jgi:hypothetical protein